MKSSQYLCVYCNKPIYSLYYCQECHSKVLCSKNCLFNHYHVFHKEIFEKSNSNKDYAPLIKSQFYIKGRLIESVPYIFTHSEFNGFLIAKKKSGTPIELGSGSYSVVYLVKHVATGKKYALKRMRKDKIYKKLDSLDILTKEVEFHAKLFHKNIVHLVGVFENSLDYFMILEFMSKGNLYSMIKSKSIKTEEQVFKYFIQVVNAINFLHENNLIHRDIKPENILMNEEGDLKLCDFGCCNQSCFTNNRNTFCGTLEYIAPEILSENKYGKPVDIWSLGILLYELSHGYTPFNYKYNKGKSQDKIYRDIKYKTFDFARGMIFSSEELVNLLEKMIVFEPDRRIKIYEIYNSDFIQKFETGKIESIPLTKTLTSLKPIYRLTRTESPNPKIIKKKQPITSSEKSRKNNIFSNHIKYKQLDSDVNKTDICLNCSVSTKTNLEKSQQFNPFTLENKDNEHKRVTTKINENKLGHSIANYLASKNYISSKKKNDEDNKTSCTTSSKTTLKSPECFCHKTIRKNYNGVKVSAKLVDALAIFKMAEEFKYNNEVNSQLYQ